MSPEIKSNLDSDEEHPYSYLEYNFDDILVIFKGDLIDYLLYYILLDLISHFRISFHIYVREYGYQSIGVFSV